ncbi:MAG: hypothetical protein O3B04_02630 [Chloroflexi bacterium]|nr:hypothetical protein [Chloroflexota bacterium]
MPLNGRRALLSRSGPAVCGREWNSALSEDSILLTGQRSYTRVFPDWFQLNYFASIAAGVEKRLDSGTLDFDVVAQAQPAEVRL